MYSRYDKIIFVSHLQSRWLEFNQKLMQWVSIISSKEFDISFMYPMVVILFGIKI